MLFQGQLEALDEVAAADLQQDPSNHTQGLPREALEEDPAQLGARCLKHKPGRNFTFQLVLQLLELFFRERLVHLQQRCPLVSRHRGRKSRKEMGSLLGHKGWARGITTQPKKWGKKGATPGPKKFGVWVERGHPVLHKLRVDGSPSTPRAFLVSPGLSPP